MLGHQKTLASLTEDQQKAVLALKEIQKTQLFIGVSPEVTATDFAQVNITRETDAVRASAREQELFALCGYDPSNTT
jgi:hypothetical protein